MKSIISIFALLTALLTGCTSNIPSVEIPTNPPLVITSGENTVEVKDFNLENEFNILKLMPDDKNYMVSPFSLKMAMSLALNGANGETKNEILNAFGIKDLDAHNISNKELIERLNSQKEINVNVANSIWLNKDIAGKNVKFKDSYKKDIEEFYQGVANEETKDKIASKINKWVEEKTNNKIKNLLDDSKDAEFIAVLVNTIYLKAPWLNEFNERATKKDTFTSRDETKTQIDFMNKKDHFSYYEDENMKMIKLPYSEGRISMGIVIPENEKIDIKSALDNMKREKVDVSIPKFKIEYSTSMKDLLKSINVKKAFSKWDAEFKDDMFVGIREDENVYIDDVLQKTFIEVDEKGTEAAAATAVIMNKATAMPPREEEVKIFKADKPFIFFIIDEISNEVMFIGEYAYAK